MTMRASEKITAGPLKSAELDVLRLYHFATRTNFPDDRDAPSTVYQRFDGMPNF